MLAALVVAAVGVRSAGAGPADAPVPGLTPVDLSDSFVPRVLRADPGHQLDYAETYRVLAGELDLQIWGVFPTFGVLAARLADQDRHACHAAVEDAELAAYPGTIERDERTPVAERDRSERRAATRALQQHLACEGLLAADAVDQRFGRMTGEALAVYRRRHMVAAAGGADPEVRALLAGDSRELDFRAVLRALRERVIDATGLIEDGSARGERGLVLGRAIDPVSLLDSAGHPPHEQGAPDLVSPAVEAAARALGWTDPASAQASIERMRREGVTTAALPLPPLPRYHAPVMELRAEIDRGDVWYDDPLDRRGRRRAQPRDRRPVMTLYAHDGAGEVALVRWPTTIGTWQREKRGGRVVRRYKGSPTGRFVWRDLFAAPAWFPPPSTPDQELVRRSASGAWVTREDTVGPGHLSAYGLVMIVHQNPGGGDTGIRTHGTGSYLSIAEGSASHGCHRLLSHHALRLAGFLLARRSHLVRGQVRDSYLRGVRWAGRRFTIRRNLRGYLRVLDPPVAIEVLEGRIRGRARRPIRQAH